jgi:hypothetical protein
MKPPIPLVAFVLSVSLASAQTLSVTQVGGDSVAGDRNLESSSQSPIKLGPQTPEGFNDPAHVYFFRYQAYLQRNDLQALDAAKWKALTPDERAEKIKTGEAWLEKKFKEMLSASPDTELISAVWGKDVSDSIVALHKAAAIGDPDQIRAERDRLKSLLKGVGGASVDWKALFDGAAAKSSGSSDTPNPLALKEKTGFLASLESKEVRAPLENRDAFTAFLREKKVTDTALPALVAMYDVLSRAVEPEKSQIAHILPTVVRFLLDGKDIREEDLPGVANALAFAKPDDYSMPDYVGITTLSGKSDPVEIGDLLAHEFEHVYDQYTGRYYTLDSELRGFKTNVLFLDIMKKDPQLSKKLVELRNSDDDATRSFFRDQDDLDAKFAESREAPQAFASVVAFGHGYDSYNEGTFSGRLTLRQAVDPNMGLERQISGETRMVTDYRAQVADLSKRLAAAQLAAAQTRSSTLTNDKNIQKLSRDLAIAQTILISRELSLAKDTLQFNRMSREVQWMDQRATAAGKPQSPYDLNLAVTPDYIAPGG